LKFIIEGSSKLLLGTTTLTSNVDISMPAKSITLATCFDNGAPTAQANQLTNKAYVDSTVAAAPPPRQPVSNIAATTYTVALTDENKLLVFSAATAITLNPTTDATVNFPVGARIDIVQIGAGKITVSSVGMTLYATPSAVLRAQGSTASLVKLASNTWLLTGDLT
jgi:hypothetical protein